MVAGIETALAFHRALLARVSPSARASVCVDAVRLYSSGTKTFALHCFTAASAHESCKEGRDDPLSMFTIYSINFADGAYIKAL
jgi:hypothetical protein